MPKRCQISFEVEAELRDRFGEAVAADRAALSRADVCRMLLVDYIRVIERARAEGDTRLVPPREEPRPQSRPRERKPRPQRRGGKKKGVKDGEG